MKDEILAGIQQNMRIESVRGEAQPDAPYGPGPKAALEDALELGRKLGFKVGQADNRIGWVEYGEGKEMVGVLGHVDVVPAGDTGWTYPAYGAEIHDGILWGRGCLDDKGPIIGSIYALKAIRDLNLPIDRRIRVIFGSDEECHILRCMNTGKLCLFTSDGKMHQIKVMDLPYGKFRDKGFPIDNVSNFDSTKEEIVYLCDDRELFFSKFLFVTKQGMIKKVAGSEFQVTKRTIAATKLQDEDALVSIRPIRDAQDVVLMTENGFVLRFPAEEVSEKKKGAVGVRGMKLQKNDSVEEVYLFEEGTESKVIFHEKEVTLNRLKRAKRDGTGTRMRK